MMATGPPPIPKSWTNDWHARYYLLLMKLVSDGLEVILRLALPPEHHWLRSSGNLGFVLGDAVHGSLCG